MLKPIAVTCITMIGGRLQKMRGAIYITVPSTNVNQDTIRIKGNSATVRHPNAFVIVLLVKTKERRIGQRGKTNKML